MDSDLEDRIVENHPIWTKKKKKRKEKRILKCLDSLRNFWDNITHTNICIIEVPREERKRGTENIIEVIVI